MNVIIPEWETKKEIESATEIWNIVHLRFTDGSRLQLTLHPDYRRVDVEHADRQAQFFGMTRFEWMGADKHTLMIRCWCDGIIGA